jgi:sodium/hydrogen exchanger 8
MQFIMWFSGLRGAIAFALSLNLNIDDEVRHVIVTSTLILVLFTTLILGGSAMPIIKVSHFWNHQHSILIKQLDNNKH